MFQEDSLKIILIVLEFNKLQLFISKFSKESYGFLLNSENCKRISFILFNS